LVPASKVVLDNYATHKHPKVRKWLTASRLLLKIEQRASRVERLRGFLGFIKIPVGRSGACLPIGERDLQERQLLVGLEPSKGMHPV
jgi:hypothetical protein